eukprot:2026038-Amphidinium_carterae.1
MHIGIDFHKLPTIFWSIGKRNPISWPTFATPLLPKRWKGCVSNGAPVLGHAEVTLHARSGSRPSV